MILLLYDTGIHPAALNMAIDDVLLTKKESVLRLYQWAGTAITLGRFQSYREVNAAATKEDGIPVVRRETGGKAVLHGEDLTISLMLDKSQAMGSIKESIKPVGKGIVRALHLLGINAQQVSPGKKYLSSTCCFSTQSPYEVVVGSDKIAGIAGRIYKDRVLYQVSVPFSVNNTNAAKYFHLNQADTLKPVHGSGLKEILHEDFSFETVKRAFISGFQESLDAEITVAALTNKELEQAKSVAAEKYGRDKWNLAR